jgi:polysaccharide pyruvyl transferase WcaK-like protein
MAGQKRLNSRGHNMKVCLVGYYGKGNFGDDLLLKITYTLVCRSIPDAQIFVYCDTYHEAYLPAILPGEFTVVRPGNRLHFDLIVHGGGGNYHDYGNYGLADRFLNLFIGLFGFQYYVVIDRALRNLAGRRWMTASTRVGWGVGIGTFNAGSPRLRHSFHELMSFEKLFVRDRMSLENLERIGACRNAILGSDLAFLTDVWLQPTLSSNSKKLSSGKPKLGLILRDWPTPEAMAILVGAESFVRTLEDVYEVTIFVFDQRDHQVLGAFNAFHKHVWVPNKIAMGEYCGLLASQNVIITSRAHGAICAAILGVPSLILEIEPKLRTIHELLPRATRLISPQELLNKGLKQRIDELLGITLQSILEDVSINADLTRQALSLCNLTNP